MGLKIAYQGQTPLLSRGLRRRARQSVGKGDAHALDEQAGRTLCGLEGAALLNTQEDWPPGSFVPRCSTCDAAARADNSDV